jgi:hypothetical protein
MNKWLNPRSAFGIALITIALLGLPFVAAMGGQAWVRILDFAILTVRTVYAVFPGISIRTGISFLPVTDSNRSTFGEGDSIPRTIRQFLDMSNVISYPVGIDNHLKIINILIQFFT